MKGMEGMLPLLNEIRGKRCELAEAGYSVKKYEGEEDHEWDERYKNIANGANKS
jgi:hypothetical protein